MLQRNKGRMVLLKQGGSPQCSTKPFSESKPERCLRLADTARDPVIARELRAIGQAFLDKAAELDAEQRTRGG